MKIAIYSVLFGDYDEFKDPTYVQPNADYYLFTDQDIKSELYIIHKVETGDNPILTARQYKIVYGYEFLCDLGYNLIIYTDCNIVQKHDLNNLIDLQDSDLMILKHPTRDCIYEEFHACYDANKGNKKTMIKQVRRYGNQGYPKNNGLVASGVIFRRNSKKVLNFCKAWLKEVENGSIRDQLSFNYVAEKRKFKFDLMEWNFIYDYWDYNSKHKK